MFFHRLPVTTGLLVSFALAAAVPAAAKPAPVALKALAVSPSAISAGGVVTAKAVVSARAARAAGHVRLRYVLSRDARLSREDRQLAVVDLGRVRAGKRAQRRTPLTIPAAVGPGRYHLIGCIGTACRAAALAVAAAQSSGGPVSESQASGGPGQTPGSPPASGGGNSRSITPALDGAHAATGTIGHDGGTLTATGADGSTYTLTLPAGALAGDIAITLTPVSSIAGLPLSGGSAAAVDIAPDGLALMQPATLAINPAAAPAVADQRGFSWHDDPGHEVYLRGLEPKAPIEMQLEHFSGYGVGSGTPTASWTPSRTLDQLEQDLVQTLIAERARVLAGEAPNPAVMDQYFDTLVAAYDQRVKPRMQAAETDDELATSAIQLGYGWAHEAAILGSAESPDPRFASRMAEVEASVRRILSNAFDKAYAKCMAGEPAYAQRLVGFERWSQILGYGLPDGVARARECLSFELTVDAMVDAHVGWATFEEHVVVDRLPIRIGDQDFTGRGTKQLTFPKWTVERQLQGLLDHRERHPARDVHRDGALDAVQPEHRDGARRPREGRRVAARHHAQGQPGHPARAVHDPLRRSGLRREPLAAGVVGAAPLANRQLGRLHVHAAGDDGREVTLGRDDVQPHPGPGPPAPGAQARPHAGRGVGVTSWRACGPSSRA